MHQERVSIRVTAKQAMTASESQSINCFIDLDQPCVMAPIDQYYTTFELTGYVSHTSQITIDDGDHITGWPPTF